MTMVIVDPGLQERIIADRQATGLDRKDEVWEGVYVISPDPNIEHQDLVGGLQAVLSIAIRFPGLGQVLPGTNVTDRQEDWLQNYRCPDVAVYLNDTKAENRGSHWLGGPDLAVEIISPFDRSREKQDFYAQVGTRELWLIDRDPWAVEIYSLDGTELILSGRIEPDHPEPLTSNVTPFSLRLLSGTSRPEIEFTHNETRQTWTI